MSATLAKICESNGTIVYRVTVQSAHGSTKIENFARLFDAQKRIRQIEEEGTKKNVTGNHYS